jgi:uncharacterized protein (TIGR02145 family)
VYLFFPKKLLLRRPAFIWSRKVILYLLFFLVYTYASAQTITVNPDTTICLGGTASLTATVVGGGYGTSSYSFQLIPYNPMPFSGGVPLDTSFHSNQCTSGGQHDDCWGGPFDIGFSFCFLNVNYNQFWVGSNGWISFSQPNNSWDNYIPDTLPNSTPNTPKNCIMAPWQDWYPGAGGVGNNIYYYTSGVDPFRQCVIYWLNVPFYSCTTTFGTFQIVLNEQNSIIENNIASKPACLTWQGNKATQGVQNLAGTVAFIVPGRNNSNWTAANESTRFVPEGVTWYTGGYPGGNVAGYGAHINVTPIATTTYTGVVEVCGGSYSAADVTVTVMDPAFHYTPASFCQNGANPVPQVTMLQGVFTSTPPGLVFADNITGEINVGASIPGTYVISHTISVPCIISAIQTIIINAPPADPVAINPVVSRCGPGPVTFGVMVGTHKGVKWYDAPTGGNLLPFTTLNVTTTIVATTFYYAETMDSITGCHSIGRTQITAILNPIPSITNTILKDTICSGFSNNFPLLADLPGTSFIWTATCSAGNVTGFTSPGAGNTISDLLTNNLFTTGEVTYTVIPVLTGCQGIPQLFRTEVNPRPNVIIQAPNPSICSGQTTSITLSSGVSGVVFSWTATPGSANITGYSNGTGNQILQTLMNSGTTMGTVTYTIIATKNGCVSQNYTQVISVSPVAAIMTSPLTDTLCSQTATNILLSSNVAGAVFSWTAALTSGNITGFSNGSGNQIIQVLTNNGFVKGVVTYSVTPSINGCPGIPSNFIITVEPKPDVSNFPLSKHICNGESTVIQLQSNVASTQFSWTSSGSSGNVAGFHPGSGLLINDTLINSGFNTETVTYAITPHANGCDGTTVNWVVTVYPTPDVYFLPASQVLCSPQPTAISLLSHTAGTTFSWTTSPSGPTLTGYSDGTGSFIGQPLVNTGITIDSITYHVTPVANGCPAGITMDIKVIDKPKPLLTNSPLSKFICNNTATAITLTCNIPGNTFTWTAAGSSGFVIGYSNGSGSSINQVLQNSGTNIETVTYTITTHMYGCDGDPTNYVVSVYPVPGVIFTPNSQTICSLTSTSINLTSLTIGANFTWTASGSSGNITGFSTGAGSVISQLLTISGYTIESVTYSVTPHISVCNGITRQVVGTVHPVMATSFGNCIDTLTILSAQPYRLKGGIPLGGTYTGNGVNPATGIFYPAIAGIGLHPVTYSYTNQYTCTNTAIRSIHVIPDPFFTCGDTLMDIRDLKKYPTIVIGGQCWQAANLNYGTYIASTQYQRDNCVVEKFCYSDNSATCNSSGGLYQWDEVMQYQVAEGVQGLCPPGWHIPTEQEWNLLFSNFINNGFAGLPLLFTGYSGFNAFVDGARYYNKSWKFNTFSTFIWSSTLHGTKKAWSHAMNTYDPSVARYPAFRSDAFSVRCLKD